MTNVRLEIDEIKIHRPKKRWNLYFVVVTEHPEENDKMILTTLPQQPIKLSRRHDNQYQFDTDEYGSEGLFVLSKEMPEDREIRVEVYLRHARNGWRNVGEILKDLQTGIGKDAFGIVTDLIGSTNPWLMISKAAVPMISKILSNAKDRDFGFVSLSEKFGAEFEEEVEIDRKKDFSGNASLVYSWSVD